ncbi:hypothetical protein JCM11491_004931 [Sporobolomyces phaffii]
MTKPERHSGRKQASYAEVDSDVDMSEGERENAHAMLGKGKQRATDDDDESEDRGSSPSAAEEAVTVSAPIAYDSKLLLGLPFDLFAEVCSHLPGGSVLELAKVNKALRRLLLSRAARSIWSAHRRSMGYSLFEGMTELQFALLNCANNCQAANNELAELEEEDETLRNQIEFARTKSSSTRTRKRDVVEAQLKADRAQTYLEEKMAWVQLEQTASRENSKNRHRLYTQALKAQREEVARQKAARLAFIGMLKSEQGWTDEEIRCHEAFPQFAPETTVDEDPQGEHAAAWQDYHEVITEIIAEDTVKADAAKALARRRASTIPFYNSLENEKSRWEVFPPFQTFLTFSAIRHLLEPDSSTTIDDKLWTELRPDVENELATYAEKARIEAIRHILAANRGLGSISTLSKEAADYPNSTYDETFFSLATSHFATNERRGSRRTLQVSPYPDVTNDGGYTGPGSLKARINVRQVDVVREIARAAGLDPASATCPDLDALEDTFRWTNAPTRELRQTACGWVNLLEAVVEHGPPIADFVAGKAKIAVTYASDATEEEGDELDPGQEGEKTPNSQDKTSAARESKGSREHDEDEDESEQGDENEEDNDA